MIPQYTPIYEKEEREAVKTLIDSDSWFSEFKETENFEKALAQFTETKYCSLVNNGTIALSLALLAYDIKPGDKVLVPTLSMIATANAIRFIGAVPVFGEVDENINLDSLYVLDAIRKKEIKAVIYVTLNGRIHGHTVAGLKRLCDHHGVAFIKDDAQSLGTKSEEGLYSQNELYGDIHTVSFSPHKIISCGQGGAIFTNTKELYEKIERLKDFGRLSGGGDIHDYFGINSKFTEIQSVFGHEQLKKIESKITIKKEIYDCYYAMLYKTPGVHIKFRPNYHVPWFVDIYVHQRDNLLEFLKQQGIQTRPMYPCMHTQKIYNDNKIMISEEYSKTGLWLPSSYNLTGEEIIFISNKIKEYYK